LFPMNLVIWTSPVGILACGALVMVVVNALSCELPDIHRNPEKTPTATIARSKNAYFIQLRFIAG
jgi:hypothetical protein